MLLGLVGLGMSMPTVGTRPGDSEFPDEFWDLMDYEGPGCPQEKINGRYPALYHGEGAWNTPRAWFFGFPGMSAKIGPGIDQSEAYTWCIATLRYMERGINWTTPSGSLENWVPNKTYRPTININGTWTYSKYNLDSDVTAEWTITYYTDYVGQKTVGLSISSLGLLSVYPFNLLAR